MSSFSTPRRFLPIKSQAYSTFAAHTFFHQESESGGDDNKQRLLCILLLWSTVTLVILLLLVALFLIYQPRLPAFSVSPISVKDFSVSAISASVDSRFEITVTTRNPNSKVRFEYGTPLSISVVVGGVDVADMEFAGFVHRRKHTTVIRGSVGSRGQRQATVEEMRAVAAGVTRGVATAEVKVDGKVRALFGKLRSPALVFQVRCKGLKATVLGRRKSVRGVTVAGGECAVKFKGKVMWRLV